MPKVVSKAVFYLMWQREADIRYQVPTLEHNEHHAMKLLDPMLELGIQREKRTVDGWKENTATTKRRKFASQGIQKATPGLQKWVKIFSPTHVINSLMTACACCSQYKTAARFLFSLLVI